MSLLDRAEKKFGHLAVPGIVRLIMGATVVVFILEKILPGTIELLDLYPEKVAQGEIWRLVTHLIIPRLGLWLLEYLSLFLFVMCQVSIGDGIEAAMGRFKLNVYLAIGLVTQTMAAFWTDAWYTTGMIFTTLFLAFARYYPNVQFRLFFVIPVQVRILAAITWLWLIFMFVTGSWTLRTAIIACLLNYLCFFWRDIVNDIRLHRRFAARRKKFEAATARSDDALHRCKTCGKTEADTDADFRFAADGDEYCAEHLPKP